MGERRKRWTGNEIMAVVERVLVKREDLSAVCTEVGCVPTLNVHFLHGSPVDDGCLAQCGRFGKHGEPAGIDE